ncbi:hypothetical protein [Leifsonia sp. 21MFCrub1.1]|uniref:hypothetical protein n=1 Tax=Leifsonia sp. 21MFCrub1.1 TaxID=1798223 RepID=UPI000B7CF7F6|nr:hypothetical protein [Leifsonia sp. 21MFCrub1.1]
MSSLRDRQALSSATRDGNELAHQLLRLERSSYFEADKLVTLIEQAPSKEQHVALAVVPGVCESVTSKESWYHPTAYLSQLVAWGYSLSDVEQIVTGTTWMNQSRQKRPGTRQERLTATQ